MRKTEKIRLIGIRTRNLPACSIVPQPTTLPRALRWLHIIKCNKFQFNLLAQHTRISAKINVKANETYRMSKVTFKNVCTFVVGLCLLRYCSYSDTAYVKVNTGGGPRNLWPEQANCWAGKPQYQHRSAPECGHMKPNTLMDTEDVVRQSVKCFVFFEVLVCLFAL
jgi:hypothetical protein